MVMFHSRLKRSVGFLTALLASHITQNILFISAYSPTLVYNSQYATMNGILYVQGGAPELSISPSAYNEFFSLSLTKPWNDTAPPWQALPINTSGVVVPALAGGGMTPTPNNSSLALWNPSLNPITWVFHPKNNTWTTITYTLGSLQLNMGGTAVIDPESVDKDYGDLYAPNACRAVNTSYNAMCDFRAPYFFNVLPMPPSPNPTDTVGFSFTYCTERKSILFYGGQGYTGVINPYLYEYVPSEQMWSFLVATDASRMIVFGGVNAQNQFSSRLFFLNMVNFTWTEGADAGAINARAGHVCATNGDSLVVWGGRNTTINVIKDKTPLIYNIPTNQWVHDFVVSGPLPTSTTNVTSTVATTASAPTTTSTPPVASPTPPKTSNLGSAIGAIGAVSVVAAAVGFLFFRRHRRAKSCPSPRSATLSHQSIFGKTGRFFGRSAKDDGGYRDEVQSQFTSSKGARETPYLSRTSSAPFMSQFISPSYRLSNEHELEAGDSFHPNKGDPQDSISSARGESLPFGPDSSLRTMVPQYSMATSPNPPHQLGYYLVDKDGYLTYRTGRDDNSFYTPHGHSPQFVPGGSSGYSVWSEGDRFDPRSPQQLGPGYGTSPAAWMVSMNMASPRNDPRFSSRIASAIPLSSHSSYSPSPTGQLAVQTESDFMLKKIKLLRAQHELEMERVRLEQES
ncbi:hypothetical protein EMPS_04827 [Entomortierella parvispora]|uniref:Uncharacterized protein n=1 Tax=Entomortierella parvispora TaxID=205924 RepID=A0A9P3H9C2_9FUNG|nr:hypothetical protein EMPS_04827 [Entomortierella parvispora]